MFIARAMCSCLVLQFSLQKYLEGWPAALKEAGRSILMLMKRSTIPGTELNTVHLYQHYSLFMRNKLRYTWRGDYCECVRPAELPVLTWSSSSVPPRTTSTIRSHRDRAGYNRQAIGKVSELPFPVVFHTKNCAVHSENPTVSPFYLPTPRWPLKAHNLPNE
jgi:hypothetical protein